MNMTGKVATWLELAVAPEWRRNRCKIRLHAVGGTNGSCFAISMDERWLCAGSGGVTVFNGLGAALHFLKLLRVEDFEPGESAEDVLPCDGTRFCLCADKRRGLVSCSLDPEHCRRAHVAGSASLTRTSPRAAFAA
jgi:hypothetical protein